MKKLLILKKEEEEKKNRKDIVPTQEDNLPSHPHSLSRSYPQPPHSACALLIHPNSCSSTKLSGLLCTIYLFPKCIRNPPALKDRPFKGKDPSLGFFLIHHGSKHTLQYKDIGLNWKHCPMISPFSSDAWESRWDRNFVIENFYAIRGPGRMIPTVSRPITYQAGCHLSTLVF